MTVDCVQTANVLSEDVEDIEAVQPQEDTVETYINSLAETEEVETEGFSSIIKSIMEKIKKLVAKMKADLEKKRALNNSKCSDKYVCEYKCSDVMPTCTSKASGFFDLTDAVKMDSDQKTAYNWVCKNNIFSGLDQKMSYASIMFRVVVQSLTHQSMSKFEKEKPNTSHTKYDDEYVKWVAAKVPKEINKIAVIRVLNKFKDGLKGFVNVCRSNTYYFKHLQYRLEKFERDAEAKAKSGSSSSIRADSAAYAAHEEDNWETSTELSKDDKVQRKDLMKKAKKLFKEKFLRLISGMSTQKDFCLCSDYQRFFQIMKSQSASTVKSTFGISNIGFKYRYMEALENKCKNNCPCRCPNGGICQKDGSCRYNFYNVGPINQQKFPIEYKANYMMQFEMGSYDTYVMLSSSRSNGASVYFLVFNGWGNKKSYLGYGKWYNGKITGLKQIAFVSTGTRTGPTQVWVTFQGGYIKAGYGTSYGSGQFLNHRPTTQFTPRYIGVAKYSGAPRNDVIDFRQRACNGRGYISRGKCRCSFFYSGTYCQTRKRRSWRW
eukprot:gene4585-7969_t